MTPANAPSVTTQASLTHHQSSLRMACILQSVSQSVSQSENLPYITTILLIKEFINRDISADIRLFIKYVPTYFHLHKKINPQNYSDMVATSMFPPLMLVLMNMANAALFNGEKGGDEKDIE